MRKFTLTRGGIGKKNEEVTVEAENLAAAIAQAESGGKGSVFYGRSHDRNDTSPADLKSWMRDHANA